jgi:cytochrome oxidase Cu insertion factor (SCO1/SenC/PrrC family)
LGSCTGAVKDGNGRVYGDYEIIPTPESAMKYTVAHSTTVYALDALGRTRVLFSYDAKVDEIVEGLRNILTSSR